MTRPALAVLAMLAALGSSAGCGGGEDAGDVPRHPSARDLATLAGHAPAARGAGLETPPGPADRVPLDTFDAGGIAFGEVAISLMGPDGDVLGWCVLLAASADQRRRGLMEVTDLGGYAGMLFVWDAEVASSFYMRNTPTPLSIAWFEADGSLVSTADMEPCVDAGDCPTYAPGDRHRFALEVPQGSLGDVGVAAGTRLAVGGPCADRT